MLVSHAVRDRPADLDDVELVPVGARRLKGYSRHLELCAVRPGATGCPVEQTDPVCRVELAPAEIAARVTIVATEHVFCSTDCLWLFAAAPTGTPLMYVSGAIAVIAAATHCPVGTVAA